MHTVSHGLVTGCVQQRQRHYFCEASCSTLRAARAPLSGALCPNLGQQAAGLTAPAQRSPGTMAFGDVRHTGFPLRTLPRSSSWTLTARGRGGEQRAPCLWNSVLETILSGSNL